MNKFLKFILTAEDKTARAFRSFGERMKNANKSGDKVSKMGKAWDKLTQTKLGGKFRGMAGDMGELAEGAGAAVEGLGLAGAATAGVAAAVVGLGVAFAVATKKGWEFVEPFAKGSNEILRTSRLLGISTSALQQYRTTAEMAGLSADDMTGSLANLGQTLQDARYGRNNEALAMLNRLGVRLVDVRGKTRNAKDVLLDLADAIQRQGSPQTQASIAQMLGVEQILPLLQNGKGALQKQIAEAAALNPGMTEEQLKNLNKMNEDTLRLGQSWSRLKLNLSEHFIIPWLGPTLDKMSDFLDKHGPQIPNMITGALTAPMVFNPANLGSASSIVAGMFGSHDKKTPLGLRNNNPGNMKDIHEQWMKFNTPEDGIGAMGKRLQYYQDKHKRNTLTDILNPWNGRGPNTGAYISNVSSQTGFGPNQPLDLHDPKTLAALQAAMIKVENGKNPFTQEQIMAANHTVDVNVTLGNAPLGSVAQVKTSPQARAGMTIATPQLATAAQW